MLQLEINIKRLIRLKSLLVICLLLITNNTYSFDGPIKIRRICLDLNDSSVNIFFNDISNPCGTFTKIEVYERLNLIDPFALKYSSAILSLNTLSFKQPDTKRRQYYLVYYTKCDGVTSLYSDTVFTDLDPPIAQTLDSVSVEFASQKVLIGWQKNSSPDYKGYQVFEQNGGNNINIKTQRTEGYLDPNSNPQIGPLSYSHNTYDSCGIASIISSPHVTIHLRNTLDFCKRTISLSWTPYTGWTTDKYFIFISINGGEYNLFDSTAANAYTLGNVLEGTNYCFFIRSKKLTSSFTSTSNISCLNVPSFIYPINTEIISLVVQDAGKMRIKWQTSTLADTKEAQLYRGKKNASLSLIGTIPVAEGVNIYQDPTNTTETSYFYKIVLLDNCERRIDSTNISESVFLRAATDTSLTYNPFKFNIGSNQKNLIQNYTSSTWNNKADESPANTFYEPLFNENDTSICFRVVSINEFGDSSSSNTICLNLPLEFYIPNALKLSGAANGAGAFGVYGTGINWEITKISVFNRWGEKVAEINKATNTWNGNYKNDKVLPGVYIYYGEVVGKKKKKTSVSGKIIIIE